MRNEILRKITIVMAIALLLLTICTIVAFISVSLNETKNQVHDFAEISSKQINNFNTLSDLDRFIYYKDGSNIRITIINSQGMVIKDTTKKEKLSDQSYIEINKLIKEGSTQTTTDSIESDGSNRNSHYVLYEKIEVGNNIDPAEFLVVRYSLPNSVGGKEFVITIVAIIAFWVVMVILLAVVFNFNIKASLDPLEKAQKIMTNIKEGSFVFENNMYMPLESEADKIINEIQSLGKMINESIDNLKLIIDSLSQGIVAFDANSNIIIKNDQINKLLGFSATTKDEFYKGLDHNDIIYHLKESYVKKKEIIKDFEFNDKVLQAKTIVSNVDKNKDGMIYFLVVISDVTKERNDLKYKNEFFANASHELKTPLTAINGYSELMMLETTSEKQIKKCAEQINKNSLKMRELIEDMLNLSKLENTERKLDKEEVILENITETILEELEILMKSKNIQIKVSGHMMIVANKKLIIMLMKNLISNAIKYNKDNGSIVITFADTTISVKDTGFGIAKKDQEKIFDRFYKLENHNNNVESSSGLGLALVQEIVKLHNGTIQVHSELDKGSEFVITFNQ